MRLIIKIFKFLIKISIIIVILFLLRGFTLYRSAVKTVPIEQKIVEITSKDNYVEIKDISDYIKEYIVNIEDKRFYKHNGIDIIAIFASVIGNLDVGYYKYGGSTITQQLAKNMYFSNEKKITRKIAEMFLAFEIERKYPKEKILELYLNIIYFGNGYYGIENASRGYFNLSSRDLNQYQSALLAGVPQAPSIYNLNDKNNESMKRRFYNILDILVEKNSITIKQSNEFKAIYLTS